MEKVQKEGLALFKKKNKDYGDAFKTFGSIGIIVRIGDKIQRLVSVTNNGINLVTSEGLRDTLIDLHNYAAMAIMLMDQDGSQDLCKAERDRRVNSMNQNHPLYTGHIQQSIKDEKKNLKI